MLLGPLAVRPSHKNLGIGRNLVRMAVDAAAKAGHGAVLLVGDAPYYGPLGFTRMPGGQLCMPGPVDPARMLICEILAGTAEALRGNVVHASLASAEMQQD